MYRISDQQIDYILNDISARGVEMESLQQNLLDHICCIIENNLEENGDFESFYKKTIQHFYKDELWEIEEETLLLLTYKNYYTMKKIMIYSGTFSVIGFIAGSIFKIMHWPGAGAILLISMAAISFVFLPLLFLLKIKETTGAKNKLMITSGTIFGILFSMSALFKIFHWPGANMMWLIALGVLLLLFIPLYFFLGIRNPETKTNTIVTTIIMFAAGGMLFTLTSLKKSTRELNNTEIEYLVSDEELLRLEEADLSKIAEFDTLIKTRIKTIKEINLLCNDLKSELLYFETGYKNISMEMKNKKIIISTDLVSNFISGNPIYKEKLRKLGNLINENSIKCYIEKLRLTKKESVKKSIKFKSSILYYEFYSFYYNNTILGSYKDLCEIQLEAMEELKELAELKQTYTNNKAGNFN